LALLDSQGSTLLGINRMLADKKYRSKVVRQLKDPVIKSFWTTEFANYEPRYQKEAVAPIQNKIGQFLSASVIRNMVAQVKSTINIRQIMDEKKILIMNLSKGRIGEDNSRLLGGMLITEIQLAAMSRVDIPEEERKDFFLYVDEFQNFATQSFANILSEARKYRLSLIMAHQYITQLDETVADAVFGNVGSMITFRVGAADAEALAKEYAPTFTEEHIVNLPKFQIFLKLMIDGVASHPFSAIGMPPIGSSTGSTQKVINVSRERYGKPRDIIEEKITRWSGMEIDSDDTEAENEKKNNINNKKIPTEQSSLGNIDTTKEDKLEENNISLQDLLPTEKKADNGDSLEEEKQLVNEEVLNSNKNDKFSDYNIDVDTVIKPPEDEPEDDLSVFFDEEKEEKIASELSIQTDPKVLPKPESVAKNGMPNNSPVQQATSEKSTKKRKRKRNRNKKNTNLDSSVPNVQNGNIRRDTHKDGDGQPKKIDQDQIVKFDK